MFRIPMRGTFCSSKKYPKTRRNPLGSGPPAFAGWLVWVGQIQITFRKSLLPPSTILRRCACRPSPCQTPNVIAHAADLVDPNGVRRLLWLSSTDNRSALSGQEGVSRSRNRRIAQKATKPYSVASPVMACTDCESGGIRGAPPDGVLVTLPLLAK